MTRDALRGIRRSLIPLTALFGLCFGAEARAADAAADALSSEAKMLMEQNRYTEACPKLEKSHRLDPSGERIFDLGRCHKEQGLLATAYYELREALDIANRDRRFDRVKAVRALLDEIEPKMPKLSITVSFKVSSLPGFELKRDGIVVRRSEWGTAFPVDPGRHFVTASAPGYKPFIKNMELQADGSLADIVISDLESAPMDRKAAPPFQPASPRSAEDRENPWSTQRKVGIAIGSVGVAALGLGTFLGVQSSAERRDAEAHCKGGSCTAEGTRARERADTLGANAAMAFIGGGIATGGGLLLFVTAPPASRSNQKAGVSAVGVGPTGAYLNAQW